MAAASIALANLPHNIIRIVEARVYRDPVGGHADRSGQRQANANGITSAQLETQKMTPDINKSESKSSTPTVPTTMRAANLDVTRDLASAAWTKRWRETVFVGHVQRDLVHLILLVAGPHFAVVSVGFRPARRVRNFVQRGNMIGVAQAPND